MPRTIVETACKSWPPDAAIHVLDVYAQGQESFDARDFIWCIVGTLRATRQKMLILEHMRWARGWTLGHFDVSKLPVGEPRDFVHAWMRDA